MVTGVQFPSFSLVPESSYSQWLDVRDLCAAYGLVLDPWQENVLRSALGEQSSGRWAATRVGLSVPRQSGKTALFEARELAGLLLFGEELIIHSAHLVPTALEGFHRIKHYFENYDDLGKRVRRIREANGDQSVEMMSGQRLLFKARARGSGRGFSPDLLMLDEAQILGEREWSAMLPSMSARPNPQAWLAGTPPGPGDDGETFTRIRESALEGADRRLCWLEWSVTGKVDVADRKLWGQTNPGLGRRISVDAVADELHSMDAGTFARERLGRWASEELSTVITAAEWRDTGTTSPPTEGRVSYALDMAPDRHRMSIGVCIQGEVPHVEAIDPLESGIGSVVDWLVERSEKAAAIVVDGQSPAMSFVPELQSRGVKVMITGAGDMATACGMFYDGVTRATLTHFAQPRLTDAVAGAKKRDIGQAGGWGWDRKSPDTDLTPLVAVTLALYGAMKAKPKKERSHAAFFR